MVGSTCQRLPNSARPAGVWLNAAPAAGYPGHHRRLPRAHGVDLGAGLAPAAGLAHHQVWRERQAGVALLLEHDRRRGAVRGVGRHPGVEVSQGGVVGPGWVSGRPTNQRTSRLVASSSSRAGSEQVSAQARTSSMRTNWAMLKVGGAPGVPGA